MDNVKNTLLKIWENTWTVYEEFNSCLYNNEILSYYTPQNQNENRLMNEMRELNQRLDATIFNAQIWQWLDQTKWTNIKELQLKISQLETIQTQISIALWMEYKFQQYRLKDDLNCESSSFSRKKLLSMLMEKTTISIKLFKFLTEIQDYIYYSSEEWLIPDNHIFFHQDKLQSSKVNDKIILYHYLSLYTDLRRTEIKDKLIIDNLTIESINHYFSMWLQIISNIMHCEKYVGNNQNIPLRNCQEEDDYVSCMSDLNEKKFCIALEEVPILLNTWNNEQEPWKDFFLKINILTWLINNDTNCDSDIRNTLALIKLDEEILKNTEYCKNLTRISNFIHATLEKYSYDFSKYSEEYLVYQHELDGIPQYPVLQISKESNIPLSQRMSPVK